MDLPLLFAQFTLGALGIVGVALSEPGAGFEHMLRILMALACTFIFARIPSQTIIRLSPFAYLIVLIMLVLVLFIGVSPASSEAKRWFLIGGVTIQPSELMKVAVIAYLSAFFYNHLGDWQLWRPMLVIGLAVGLIMIEPNFSTAAFLFCLAFAIMLAAGTTFARLLSITLVAGIIAFFMVSVAINDNPYVLKRFHSWYNIVIKGETQPNDDNYQNAKASDALKKGGLFGIGSSQAINIPEADTDMIAGAIAQALGFIGIASLGLLYIFIAYRGLGIAATVQGPAALLASGATFYICGQAGLNLLVASGAFPITGIPLPFVSYGFNSLISVGIAMGFIHNAYREIRQQTPSNLAFQDLQGVKRV